jgi:predicted RNA-binding protein with PUA-like domain
VANRWLLKTEPSTYSYDDLERDRSGVWDGVANPVALKHLRAMAVGDECLIYHTGDQKRIVGMARVTKAAYPDPKQSDPKLVVVDLVPVKRVPRPVTLREVKASELFAGWDLVRLPRLSVMPVTGPQWEAILAWPG